MDLQRQPAAVLRAHGFHALSVERVVCETRGSGSFVLSVPDGAGLDLPLSRRANSAPSG